MRYPVMAGGRIDKREVISMINVVVMTGRLTDTPELKQTPNGTAVCTVNIAVDDGWGEDKRTYFPPIVLWKHRAEYAAKYGEKGCMVTVKGRWTERKWEKDGIKHKVVEIMADEIMIHSKGKQANTTGATGGRFDPSDFEEIDGDELPF